MLLPLVAGSLGTGLVADAAAQDTQPDTISITLHKKKFNSNEGLDEAAKPNTGLVETFGGEALNGVDFSMYDVTDTYYNLLADNPETEDINDDGMDQQDAIDWIEANWDAKYVKDNYTFVEMKTTTGTGEAAFTNIATKESGDNGRNRVIMFLETYSPADVNVISAPMVVHMPVMMPDLTGEWDGTAWLDTYNDDVHLYPKNVVQESAKNVLNATPTEITYTKDGETHTASVIDLEKGVPLDYQIQVPVPYFIDKVDTTGKAVIQNFKIVDTPILNLALIPGSLTVTAGTTVLDEGTDYTLEPAEEGGFELVILTDIGDPAQANTTTLDKLAAVKGGVLTVDYQMLLTGDAIPDELHGNTATIDIGRGDDYDYKAEVTPPEKPVTGGRKFAKIDGSSKVELDGAEFILWNEDKTEYAVFYDGEAAVAEYAGKHDSVEWVTPAEDAPKATVFTTTDGLFEVDGLKYGSYVMEEKVAPDGYALPTNGLQYTDFEVFFGSYDYDIVNAEVGEAASDVTVYNTKKGALPSTGGTGIFAFLAVGTALMMGAYLWFKNSKKQEV
ncbi:peptidase [Enterococcus canis]|uniref:Peptidase n=2 Tax=Enterococcus canis TaxID=214095 RepID=A0A1L8RCP1_9ENTE|nr:peptidase [Enterococcus canis]